MTDYTQQLEEEVERLKQKLDETVANYDALYNDEDALRNRVRELGEKSAQRWIDDNTTPKKATQCKMSPEAIQDFQNMHGVFSHRTIAAQFGIEEAEIDKMMKEYFNAE